MLVKNDFFAPMYSDNGLNHFMFAVVIIAAYLGILLMLGIIWYERYGNHRCRTAINQLFSTLVWVVISYIILVYIPEGIRYLQGPLNENFCEFHNLMKNVLPNCFLLTMDCIILLRYIFIFKISNFTVVKDDLVVRIFNISIILVGFWLSLVKRMSPGSMPLDYHLCAGTNPNEKKGHINHKSGEFNTTKILVCFSFMIHVVILTKIFLYEWRMEKAHNNVNIGTIQNAGSELPRQRKIAWSNESKSEKFPNMSKSMIDFTTQLLCMLVMVVVAILNSVKNATKPEELNQDRNGWYAYSQQAGFGLSIIAIPLVYYGRKKYISKTI